ncbi:MAG: DNA-binding protein [Bacteroidales bacterium]|nr:DNA-binding protein [Bacteroidales bacterium]MDZ4205094.1 DNA-binding protein [Bacteroidales bacterium]
MPKKKPFVLRLDPLMMELLEKWAADEFRSLNGQIEWLLHRALKEAARLKNKASSET